MSKIVITGGFGYIGSALLDTIADNHEIIVIDNLIYKNQPFMRKNIQHINSDISCVDNFEKYIDGADFVVHLAALVGDPVCSKNPDAARSINYDASIRLIEASKRCGIKRFVFVSTCSNYGKMDDSSQYIDEQGALKPVSLYAQLKVEVEKYLLANKTENFSPIILRFATAYGLSKRRMRFDLTVNEFTRDSILKNELVIYGEQFWRPYAHISDISDTIVKVLHADIEKVGYEVFNVGSTEENYTKQMLYELLKKENPSLNVTFVKQGDDPRDYKVNFDKIKKVLGFIPKYRVIDGIREIAAAIKDNCFENPYSAMYRNEL